MNEKDIEILVRRIISEMKPPRERSEEKAMVRPSGEMDGETLMPARSVRRLRILPRRSM